MEYILIIAYLFAPGTAVATAEFKTKTACEAARTEILKRNQSGLDHSNFIFCVPKG